MSQTPQQKYSTISKQLADKIGRLFNLIFNRATMYNIDHPTTNQSISDFFQAMSEGLVSTTLLTIILNRDQIFVEDEALDHRVNPMRLVSHFKKAGVQSISFKKGLREKEIENFLKVFINLNDYPSADAMKKSLPRFKVQKIGINHVVFKKVTTDEKVVSKKDTLKADTTEPETPKITKMEKHRPRPKVVLPEVAKNLTLDHLIKEPSRFSEDLVKADVSHAEKEASKGQGAGMVVAQQMRHIADEFLEKGSKMDLPSMEKVAEAVQHMRENVFDEIETQKTLGAIFQDESAIEDEINDLSDKVIIRLVREEYRQGEISTKRLSQILRRLIPDSRDLKRLLPKIKETLIEEGMPLQDFLVVIKELNKELKDEGLAQALHDGAEEIGLSADDLIREIRKEPKAAAELIALAAEIREELGGGGDKNALTEILVDYVEKVSGQMAVDAAKEEGTDEGNQLEDIMKKVEEDLLEKMRAGNIEADLLKNIKTQLSQRMEEGLGEIKSNVIVGQLSQGDPSNLDVSQVLDILQNTTDEDDDLRPILELVKEKMESRGWTDDNFQNIYNSIYDKLEEEAKGGLTKPPKGALARKQILFILQGEINRAARYPYPFSTITLKIGTAKPLKLTPIGSISQSEIMHNVLKRLVRITRKADYPGVFDPERALLIMPFTDSKTGEPAKERIIKALTANPFEINGIPMTVEVHPFLHSINHDEKPPSIKAFVQAIIRDSRS